MQDQMDRQTWMGILAKSAPDMLRQLWNDLGLSPNYSVLRPAEIGLVMVRGRMGGEGNAFNLGEMTVTRCAVSMGQVTGHGYVQGRDTDHAMRAALVDALMQTDLADRVRAAVIDPLRARAEQARAQRAAKAGATKVDFFTLVRGEG